MRTEIGIRMILCPAAENLGERKNLPAGGGQAAALAKALDRWAHGHPDPYLGPHWPST